MRHEQYRDGLLEKLRKWRLSNPGKTISDARTNMREALTTQDIDLLFDNWLNANFDRIELTETRRGSIVASIRSLRVRCDPEQRRREDVLAATLATRVRSNIYEEFAARIWNTVLPNGVVLHAATGKDLHHAAGWYGELGKRMRPTEKVVKKFSTKQLFDLSQRSTFKEIA